MASDTEMTWQAAVANLAEERTRAEMAASLLKKYGDAATIDRLSVRYASAKAIYDGVIAALVVALAQKQEPDSLEDLEGRLREGFSERQAFSSDINRLLPPTLHQKGDPMTDAIEAAVKAVIGPVLDAVKAIWLRTRDDNALMRKTIETQLNAARWLDFKAIPKAP